VEGQVFELRLTALDLDGDPVVYGATNLPVGATFDAEQGVLRWTPDMFQSGDYAGIVLSASDGDLQSSEAIGSRWRM